MTTLKNLFISRACKIGLAVLLAASMVPFAALSAAPAFAEDTEAEQVATPTDEQTVDGAESNATTDDEDASEASDERSSFAADADSAEEADVIEPEQPVNGVEEGIDPDRDGNATPVDFDTLETTVNEPFSFFSPLRLLFGADNKFTAPLKEGNYANWIDRLDLTDAPYGRDFYNMLIEASDNDGDKDWLIDFGSPNVLNRTNAQLGNIYISPADSNVVGFLATIVQNTETVTPGVLTDTEAKVKEYINEIYGAFDRDYPTSFWRDVKFGTTFWRPADGSGRSYCLFVLKTSTMDIRAKGYQTAAEIKQAITKLNADVKEIKDAYEASDLAKQSTEYSRVKFYNEWICENNEYNTSFGKDPNLQANNPDVWSAASALDGRKGANGPVCEGYSRAMKLLCDSDGIGCVLVDGNAPGAGPHMWNYVRVGGNWYALDITWNNSEKPTNHERYLLVGGDTFLARHPATNQFVTGGTSFSNGPVLSAKAYDPNNVTFAGIIANGDSFAYGDSFALSSTSTVEGDVEYSVTGPAKIEENPASTPAQAATVGIGPLLTITGLGDIKVTATLTPKDNGSVLSNTITIKAVPRPLKVTGTKLASRVYDGTTAATVATAGQLSTGRPNVSYAATGVIEGDTVSVAATGASYNDKTAGATKTGSASYRLEGDADTLKKYTLTGNETDATATGAITKRPVTAYFTLTNTRVLITEDLPTGTVRFETATDGRGKLADDNLEPENPNVQMTGMPTSMPTDLVPGDTRTYDVTWATPNSSVLTQINGVPDASNYDVTLSTDTEQNTVKLTIVNLLNAFVVDAESPASGATYRVECFPDINDETLATLVSSVSGLSSREDITDALMDELSNQATSDLTSDNTAVYDMTLYVKNDKGEDVLANADNFPKEGVRVTLGYPVGTNASSHKFYAAHMFTHEVTSNDGTHNPGEIEKPATANTSSGVSFTLMGFSPVSMAWEVAPQNNASGSDSSNSSSDNFGSGSNNNPTNPAGTANPDNSNITTQAGQNTANGSGVVQTGDSPLVITLVVCVLIVCIALIAFLVIRRSKKGDKK